MFTYLLNLLDAENCKEGDSVCAVSKEVSHVVMETVIVFVAVGMGGALWNRLAGKKVRPRNHMSGQGYKKQMKRVHTPAGYGHRSRAERHGDTVNTAVRNADGETAVKAPKVPVESEFHLLIRSYSGVGRTEGILRVLQLMVGQGVEIGNGTFDAALRHFPTKLPTSGDDIFQISSALSNGGFRPSSMSISTVLSLLIEAEAWEPAFCFLQTLPGGFEQRAEDYASLGLACKAAGQRDVAIKIYRALVAADAREEGNAIRQLRNWIKEDPLPQPRPMPGIKDGGGTLREDEQVEREWSRTRRVCVLPYDSEEEVRKRRFGQFSFLNGLDVLCQKRLSLLPEIQLRWIMDIEFLVAPPDRTSAATVVLRRMSEAAEKPVLFWESYPTVADVDARLAAFIEANKLDQGCVHMLTQLPRKQLGRVMDYEFAVKVDSSKGTSSAKVIGHILRLRRNTTTAKLIS